MVYLANNIDLHYGNLVDCESFYVLCQRHTCRPFRIIVNYLLYVRTARACYYATETVKENGPIAVKCLLVKLWCPIVTLIYSYSPPFYIIHYVYVCSFTATATVAAAAIFVITHNLHDIFLPAGHPWHRINQEQPWIGNKHNLEDLKKDNCCFLSKKDTVRKKYILHFYFYIEDIR